MRSSLVVSRQPTVFAISGNTSDRRSSEFSPSPRNHTASLSPSPVFSPSPTNMEEAPQLQALSEMVNTGFDRMEKILAEMPLAGRGRFGSVVAESSVCNKCGARSREWSESFIGFHARRTSQVAQPAGPLFKK